MIGGWVDVNSEDKTRNMSKSEKENHRHTLKRRCTYPGKGSGAERRGNIQMAKIRVRTQRTGKGRKGRDG